MTETAAVSQTVHAASPVHILLRGIVDYAGLFPPASLSMVSAAGEYAEHRNGAFAWALGRFVIPAARLEEFEGAAADVLPREGARSWALSALVGSDLEEDLERIERFNDRHRDSRSGAVYVDTVELKTHSVREITRAGELLDRRFDTYMEISVGEDPGELAAAIATTMAKAKIRTGGVSADAFPSSAQVVRFILRCLEHEVAFKATAGLHHPWRDEYPLTYASDAPRGTMFGFLNVLLATVALRAGWSEADATLVIEERDTRAVRFVASGICWRDRELSLANVALARESLLAFGSCSFRDPIHGLQSSALL